MIRFLKRHVWPWSEIERLKRDQMPEAVRKEMLALLDHTDSLVRFCSVSGIDRQRYYDGGNAFWSVVYRIAGDDAAADRLRDKVGVPNLPFSSRRVTGRFASND